MPKSREADLGTVREGKERRGLSCIWSSGQAKSFVLVRSLTVVNVVGRLNRPSIRGIQCEVKGQVLEPVFLLLEQLYK